MFVVAQANVASRLKELTQFVEVAQKFFLAFSLLIGTGITGLVIATRKLLSRLRGVEDKVAPVQEIVRVADKQVLQRNVEHLSNQSRLDTIEHELRSVTAVVAMNNEQLAQAVADGARTRDDVAELRELLLKMLQQKAGLG